MKSVLVRLPPRVNCVQEGSNILLVGPKGKVVLKCSSNFVQRSGALAFSKAPTGQELFSLRQALYGISLSHIVILVLQGVGYRVENPNNKIFLKLGYSHIHSIPVPDFISVNCTKNEIHLRSSHIIFLNSFASSLRKLRFPDSYKGCGILYKNEFIRLKEGKKT